MPSDRRLAIGVGLDVFVVMLFVAIGRRNHDEGSTLTGLLDTAAPFVVGLAVAWLAGRAWRSPTAIRTGLVVWAVTVAAGMVVRNVVFGDGTATPFVIVATAFLGAALLGWRAVAQLFESRRRPATQSSGGTLTAR